jgi:hypothetical protein
LEQRPSWKANKFSPSQEIPSILWNLKVHYNIYNHLSLFWVTSTQSMPPPPPSHFPKIYFNIILPSMSRSSKLPLSFRFPHQNPVWTSSIPHMCYMPCPSHSSRFDHPTNIWWGVQIKSLLIM